MSVVLALSMRRRVLAMQRRASSDASKLLLLKFFDTARRMDRLPAEAMTDDPDGWRPSALIVERARWASKKQHSVEATRESMSTDMYQCDGAGRSCYPVCKTRHLTQERRRGLHDWNRRRVLTQGQNGQLRNKRSAAPLMRAFSTLVASVLGEEGERAL